MVVTKKDEYLWPTTLQRYAMEREGTDFDTDTIEENRGLQRQLRTDLLNDLKHTTAFDGLLDWARVRLSVSASSHWWQEFDRLIGSRLHTSYDAAECLQAVDVSYKLLRTLWKLPRTATTLPQEWQAFREKIQNLLDFPEFLEV